MRQGFVGHGQQAADRVVEQVPATGLERGSLGDWFIIPAPLVFLIMWVCLKRKEEAGTHRPSKTNENLTESDLNKNQILKGISVVVVVVLLVTMVVNIIVGIITYEMHYMIGIGILGFVISTCWVCVRQEPDQGMDGKSNGVNKPK